MITHFFLADFQSFLNFDVCYFVDLAHFSPLAGSLLWIQNCKKVLYFVYYIFTTCYKFAFVFPSLSFCADAALFLRFRSRIFNSFNKQVNGGGIHDQKNPEQKLFILFERTRIPQRSSTSRYGTNKKAKKKFTFTLAYQSSINQPAFV